MQLSKTFMFVGLLLFTGGVILWFLQKNHINIGRLPGDINISYEKGSFHFPLITCIVVSVILTVLINLAIWIFKKL
jgi:hypothetical protein